MTSEQAEAALAGRPEPVEIRDSVWFYASFFVASLLLAIASVVAGGAGPVGAVLFGSYASWSLLRLITRRVRLRITAEGIEDTNHLGAPGLIRWEEILDVERSRWGLIEVRLHDEQAYWQRLSPFGRVAAAKMQLFGHGPAVLNSWGLGASKRDVLEALEAGVDAHVLASARSEKALGKGERK